MSIATPAEGRQLLQANPRRVARVAKQMEREIGSILLSDKLILDVTKPTSDGPCLCSCTGVEITNDLQVVKVYVSVYTKDEEVRTKMLSRLSGLAGYAHRLAAH